MNAFLKGHMQRSLNAVEEIEDSCRAGGDYGLHHQPAVVIQHSGRDSILVNVETDISEANHLSTSFSVRRFYSEPLTIDAA
jgi:hypothetical protein